MLRRIATGSLLLGLVLAHPAQVWGATEARTGTTRHKVRQGETLFGIARAADLHVAEVKKLNGLKTNLIRPGQLLLLPGSARKTPQATALAKALPVKAAKRGQSKVPPDLPPLPLAKIPALKGDVQAAALAFLATPYRFGAESRAATDCSGFTQQVFAGLGLSLPRTAREQIGAGALVSENEWENGDLLFFRTYARYPSHVGIYLGDGKMIHASRSQRQVVISDVNRPYFRKRLIGARRVARLDPPVSPLQDRQFVEVNDDGLLEADQGAMAVADAATPIQVPGGVSVSSAAVTAAEAEVHGSSQVTATLPMDQGATGVLTVSDAASSRE